MKKLMIAAAIVCVAAISQAATCNWVSGNIFTAADANGGWSTANIATKQQNVMMSVYLIDATTYDNLAGATQKALFDAYSTKSTTLTGQSLGENPSTHAPVYKGAITITEDADSAIAGVEYAVVIATYHDTNLDKDFYIANIAKTTYNGATSVGSAANIINARGSAATDGGWQTAAVPEPTSGLLLLLGVAGLALRRRRA